MRQLADTLRQKMGSGVVVLLSGDDGKVALIAGVTKDLIPRLHAGKIVQELARLVGGSGGGRPDLAEAGGKDTSGDRNGFGAVDSPPRTNVIIAVAPEDYACIVMGVRGPVLFLEVDSSLPSPSKMSTRSITVAIALAGLWLSSATATRGTNCILCRRTWESYLHKRLPVTPAHCCEAPGASRRAGSERHAARFNRRFRR